MRPGFGWITGTPHGNEPAGGEASVKELYELAARTDCDNERRLTNLDVFIQPVTAPDDRDHNVRTTAWSFDPNRDRGTVQMPENRALLESTATYPGLFFIDAHQQSSGYFFPPNQDAALNEISHFALDEIQNVIGPGIQQQFNDQTGQYRNYNTYDLFVPEYGDTVPALVMGSAGMTYEKGTNENYGKQVYDHYLAMDVTVNVIAAKKTELMDGWVKQWQEAVDQGASCKVQDNTQVSPPNIDLFEVGQSDDPAEPERERVRLLLPAEPALGRRRVDDQGAAARRRQRLQAELGGVGSGRAPLRELQHQRGAGRALARADRDDDAAGGDAVHPDDPGQQALDPGRPRREPVPAVQLLLRPGHLVVPAAARARRRRLPHAAAARGSLAVADRGSRPGHRAGDAAGRCTRSTPTRWPGWRW